MKFKNMEVLSFAEKELILQEARIRCAEYEVPERNLSFKMNKELQTTSGYICYFFNPAGFPVVRNQGKTLRNANLKTFAEINISVKVYKEEGFEAVMGIVRHNLAHYIVSYKYGSRDHGFNFNYVCKALGGTP